MLFPVAIQSDSLSVESCWYTSVEDVVREEASQYDWDVDLVIEIMYAESGGNPSAYNDEWHNGCQGSYGLMQIGCVNYDGEYTDLFDIQTNLQVAYRVYQQQGWSAWGVCRDKVDCF